VWDSFRDCSPPLVVLAACHSKAVGVALVAAGVRHVVATTDEVATGAAMAFTRRFTPSSFAEHPYMLHLPSQCLLLPMCINEALWCYCRLAATIPCVLCRVDVKPPNGVIVRVCQASV
jgi:hypothetical protein